MPALKQPGATAPRTALVVRLCYRDQRGGARCGTQRNNLANSVREVGGGFEAALSPASKNGLQVRWEPAGPDGATKIVRAVWS